MYRAKGQASTRGTISSNAQRCAGAADYAYSGTWNVFCVLPFRIAREGSGARSSCFRIVRRCVAPLGEADRLHFCATSQRLSLKDNWLVSAFVG